MEMHFSKDEVSTNARVRLLPDEDGVYRPYEILAFSRKTFVLPGFECSASGGKGRKRSEEEFFDDLEDGEFSRLENRRKSFNRARNRLFDLAMSTTVFDCFVTLTLGGDMVDRFKYDDVIRRLNVWLSNRVQRNGLTYVLVPEYHQNRAIHFHGLFNFNAVKTVRAVSPYTGKPLFDDAGREIYNLADFPLGFSTVIPLSGENARIATTQYCYKYITKSNGEMVGGRYYLSGGNLGRPKYVYLDVDFEALEGDVYKVGGIAEIKKVRLNGSRAIPGLGEFTVLGV